MNMPQVSNAYRLGRDAALAGSHRKPPKTASARWQAEYRAGWEAGRAAAQRTHEQIQQERAAREAGKVGA